MAQSVDKVALKERKLALHDAPATPPVFSNSKE